MTADRPQELRICLIGAGPRGTSVLERLCANVTEADRPVVVEVVDPAPAGPGAVWRPHQSPHLLMNTVASQVSMFTDESVTCDGPLVPGPSLYEWAAMVRAGRIADDHPDPVMAEAGRLGPDDYPTRSFYGHYLAWVMKWLYANTPAGLTIRYHAAQAVAVDDTPDGRQTVTLHDGTVLPGFDQVVLALGHSALAASDEEQSHRDFARRHALAYLSPANPADVGLDAVEPGMPVAVRGMGLCFFDYLGLLTSGRGGEFRQGGTGLVYVPSGREPVLYAGSRRGIPYHARGENEKGPHGRHIPRFFTPEVIAGLRAGGPAGFREHIWPIVDREVRTVYYETVIRGFAGRAAADEFVARAVGGEPEAALLDRFGCPPEVRWDWAEIERPYRDRVFADPGEFTSWLLTHLADDVAQARLGNVSGPRKAALDVLRDLRNEVRQVVDHGGITGESYRDELDAWWNPLNAFTSIGPPVRRIEEMIALIEAGVLRVLGPRMRIRLSGDGTFLAESAVVPHEPVAVRGLIEARLPEVDIRRSTNPLLRHLVRTGNASPYRIGQFESGGLAVTERPYRVVDREGRAHPARYAFGIPTEGVHWVTAAGIRPGVGSVTLEDSDAIARAALGVAAVSPSLSPSLSAVR
ncbi:FAD/NAD(P)-binding protein [Kibdelosporangium phytohabitans]|uniref:FAD-binding protein n=1 Tax=Kibdelosporangium phytohabitans TaxID=860235 RepID=A0A0N7F3G5_9PSEU|nr:FAD/NAD(P)-binding protein [Kibdelosporangium phytohabitans]ALG08567.1 FAD-binding protein [Kibdelosporangium phytohabitans]MBE1470354.1 putative NAD(P)/FAD-binding protein YdhS [Kibdelosporangium phytohabitans]